MLHLLAVTKLGYQWWMRGGVFIPTYKNSLWSDGQLGQRGDGFNCRAEDEIDTRGVGVETGNTIKGHVLVVISAEVS